MTQGCNGRVVVAYDGSESAQAAVRWASSEAARRNVGLTLLHSIMPPITSSSFGASLPAPLDILQELKEAADREMADVASALDVPRGTVSSVEIGSPSSVIVEASMDAALVVMGSRGRGGFSGLLLGSVSDQVAGHTRCPVVIVRAESATNGSAGSSNIVVGVDGSPTGQAALRFACETARTNQWSVTAVHAWQTPNYELLVVAGTPERPRIPELNEAEVRLSSEALAGVREEFPEVTINEHVENADPSSAILSAAQDAALIVVGSRGRGSFTGALLGSVSRSVLHRAHVPVAIVPEPKP
jgi:nucleotide-binding universal stress UspA family protein